MDATSVGEESACFCQFPYAFTGNGTAEGFAQIQERFAKFAKLRLEIQFDSEKPDQNPTRPESPISPDSATGSVKFFNLQW